MTTSDELKILLLYDPSAAHLEALRQAAPGATIMIASDEAATSAQIEQVEVVLGQRHLIQALPHARRLRWVQSSSVGVEQLLEASPWPEGAILTCARGVFDAEIAEHTLALALALSRELHLLRDDQRERAWRPRHLGMLAGKRCLILGWGSLGQSIGRVLVSAGMTVEGVRRRHDGPAELVDGVLLHGPGSWREALAGTALLVNALPLTPETRQLLGRAELAALPRGAHLINIGRGQTIDQQALLELLASGHLGGAALDVFEQEPPPPDDPLWSEPRLLVTPHIAHSVDLGPMPWEPLFAENLRRYVRGEQLLNVVDRQAGY